MRIDGPSGNTVGGGEEGEFNVISGNTGNGIKIVNGDANAVVANRIGTNWAGTAALGNGENGIYVDGIGNMIGVEMFQG